MKWKALIVVAGIFCVAALVIYIAGIQAHPAAEAVPQPTGQKTVEVNDHAIIVDVVDTPAAREKGLGDRDSLAAGYGMLFVFQTDGEFSFWMKDMRFAIDIVWIADDGKVVSINENVSPDTYPQTFSPISPARYVLELPENSVKRYNIHIGDIVRL